MLKVFQAKMFKVVRPFLGTAPLLSTTEGGEIYTVNVCLRLSCKYFVAKSSLNLFHIER